MNDAQNGEMIETRGHVMKKKKVLVIVGPTAVGKTALGIHLAKVFNGEIISGDSMQIYKELNIGTAKATIREQNEVKHHLINQIDWKDSYSASDFQKEARSRIDLLTAKQKLPIIVGGTGLYIQSLLYDYHLGGTEDETKKLKIREKLELAYKENGHLVMWEKLAQLNPSLADKIHPNNVRKVIRALESYALTGNSEQKEQPPELLYDSFLLGLTTDRELLYQRINQRVEMMMAQGLIEEARLLYDSPRVQASQGIGYKEFFPYFKGEQTVEECVAQVKQNSRRYAKRQLTWFRNRMPVNWWDLVQEPENRQLLEEEVKKWLEKK